MLGCSGDRPPASDPAVVYPPVLALFLARFDAVGVPAAGGYQASWDGWEAAAAVAAAECEDKSKKNDERLPVLQEEESGCGSRARVVPGGANAGGLFGAKG